MPGTGTLPGMGSKPTGRDMAIKEQVYRDPRPPEYFDRFHERSRNSKPDLIYELVRVVTSSIAWVLYRARSLNPEKVPDGPVILAPNHFSNLDHFFSGLALRRHVRFMAKSQIFKPPMSFIFTHGGVFPVMRGKADEEAFITAKKILADGGCVLMYCEGGRSRTGEVGTEAKRGIGRLALESGAPVVPVAIHGSSKVRNWKRLELPGVTIKYGDAVRWPALDGPNRDQQQEVADEVLTRIRRLYESLDGVTRREAAKAARAERREAARRRSRVTGQAASP